MCDRESKKITFYASFFLHDSVLYLYYLNQQELGQLEVLCKQLYESTDPTLRSQAEKALISFTESPDCLQKCQYVLERSTVSVHALKSSNIVDVLLMFNMFCQWVLRGVVPVHNIRFSILIRYLCLHNLVSLSCTVTVISEQSVCKRC